MNRTERAIKKQHRQIQAKEKRARTRERNDSFGKNPLIWSNSYAKERTAMKGVAAKERKLKKWHREILNDIAGKKERQEVLTV